MLKMENLINRFNQLNINKQIFIIGGVASGKSTLMNQFKEKLNYQIIDSGLLYRTLAYIIDNTIEETKLYIKSNFDELQNNNNKIVLRLNYLINKKIQCIKNTFNQIQYSDNNIKYKDISNEILQTDKYGIIASCIAKNQYIRDLVMLFINNNINDNCILTGHNLKEINTTKFSIVFLEISDKEAIRRFSIREGLNYNEAQEKLLFRNNNDFIYNTKDIVKTIYNPIIINVDNISSKEQFRLTLQYLYDYYNNKINLQKMQQELSIKQENFVWINNYYLDIIKQYCLIEFNLLDFKTVNKMDLLASVLLNISSIKPQELFILSKEKINIINNALINREILTPEILCDLRVEKINKDKVDDVIKKQFQQLLILNLAKECIIINNELLKLNIIFNDITRPYEVICNNIIYEKVTNRTILFKEISKEQSKIYSEYQHYLHSYRVDEFIAFGAFIEGVNVPIAYVSFSKHDREYKKELLYIYNLESQNVLEMTRAWNHDLAPKNIMSLLFQYSFNQLSAIWNSLLKQNIVDKKLLAITTTINPNLGFKGSSFKGCNFKVFALRPAKCSYFKIENNEQTYMTRRQIQKELENGGQKLLDITESTRYSENQIYHLQLNEMIMCFDKTNEKFITESNIFCIKEDNYKQIK